MSPVPLGVLASSRVAPPPTLASPSAVTAKTINTDDAALWGPANAFDGVVSDASGDRYASKTFTSPEWVRAQYTTPQTWAQYRVVPGGFSSQQDPTDWTLRGSNNGTSWTTLDTRTGEVFTGEAKRYAISNPGAYSYYEFNVTAISNPTQVLSISELMPLPSGVLTERAFNYQVVPGISHGPNFGLSELFRSTVAASVTGAHTFTNTTSGTLIGRLRDASGTVIASGTVTLSSTTTRHVDIPFTSPVAIAAGTYYQVEVWFGSATAWSYMGPVSTELTFDHIVMPVSGTVTFRGSTASARYSTTDVEPTNAGGNRYWVSPIILPTA